MASVTLKHNVEYAEDFSHVDLKVWVSETSDNIPGELFLFRADSPDGPGIFESVCALSDISNYPADLSSDSVSSFFRQTGVYLRFDTKTAAVAMWSAIQEDVQSFLESLASVVSAVPQETTQVLW